MGWMMVLLLGKNSVLTMETNLVHLLVFEKDS
jgi:hypothetical protein